MLTPSPSKGSHASLEEKHEDLTVKFLKVKAVANGRGKCLALAEKEIEQLKERLARGGGGGGDERGRETRDKLGKRAAVLALAGWENHGRAIAERFEPVWKAYGRIEARERGKTTNGGKSTSTNAPSTLADVRRGKAGKELAELLCALEVTLITPEGEWVEGGGRTAQGECAAYEGRINEICEALRGDLGLS